MYNLHYLLPDERRYVELLQKYYYDEISDAEREELERLVTKLNASVEAQLERMKHAW